MSFIETINSDIKKAMLARDKQRLAALRSVKSALLLAKTEKNAAAVMSEEEAIKLIKRLYKQRIEAAEQFASVGREDLVTVEIEQAAVLKEYLPEQLSEEAVAAQIKTIIEEIGATSMRDMGKVMGTATKKFAGKADNKLVSRLVKELLS